VERRVAAEAVQKRAWVVWVWSALTRPIDIFRIGVFELA
jgi:hypothetical protein